VTREGDKETRRQGDLEPAVSPSPCLRVSLSSCLPSRQPVIYLIGYRGTGKTTVARLLAQRLGWSWCDADQILEERFGKTIRQIFDEEGEAGFRVKESLILADLASRQHCVVATGGGVVLKPENRAKLKSGVAIWLTATPTIIWQRMQADPTTAGRRPNLHQGGLSEIEEMLRVREPLYRACADWTIDTTHETAEQIADRILKQLAAI
jgi:shikimate kinase